MIGFIIMLGYCSFIAKNAKARDKSQVAAYIYTIALWQILGWIGANISFSLLDSSDAGIGILLFFPFAFVALGAFISYKISTMDPIISDSDQTEDPDSITSDEEPVSLNDDKISPDTPVEEIENKDDGSTL
jgi:hypothetical protein